MKHLLILPLILIAFSLCGCSTFMSPMARGLGDGDLPYVYSGTIINTGIIAGPLMDPVERNASYTVYAVVDFPFSLAADTLLLPITIPLQINENKR